jgi:hypothetical protein
VQLEFFSLKATGVDQKLEISLNAYAFEGCCAAIDDGQVD